MAATTEWCRAGVPWERGGRGQVSSHPGKGTAMAGFIGRYSGRGPGAGVMRAETVGAEDTPSGGRSGEAASGVQSDLPEGAHLRG
jgi:hypothetical protein